jgi:hypothetical protein
MIETVIYNIKLGIITIIVNKIIIVNRIVIMYI